MMTTVIRSTVSKTVSKTVTKTLLLAGAIALSCITAPAAKAEFNKAAPQIQANNKADQYQTYTLYDLFARPILTYSSSSVLEDTACGYSQGFRGSGEDAFYAELFAEDCAEHNYAYHHAPWQKAGFDREEGKRIADYRFLYDMNLACTEVFPENTDRPRLLACALAAATYSETIRLTPATHWQSTQDRLSNNPNTQVLATMPIEDSNRAEEWRTALDEGRQRILDAYGVVIEPVRRGADGGAVILDPF